MPEIGNGKIGASVYIQKAKHAIGLDHKRPYVRKGKRYYRPYRNYYASFPGDEVWEILCNAGYAEHGKVRDLRNGTKGCTFWLTRAGLDWLGKELNIHIFDESR